MYLLQSLLYLVGQSKNFQHATLINPISDGQVIPRSSVLPINTTSEQSVPRHYTSDHSHDSKDKEIHNGLQLSDDSDVLVARDPSITGSVMVQFNGLQKTLSVRGPKISRTGSLVSLPSDLPIEGVDRVLESLGMFPSAHSRYNTNRTVILGYKKVYRLNWSRFSHVNCDFADTRTDPIVVTKGRSSYDRSES